VTSAESPLTVDDAAGWRAWLHQNHAIQSSVWLRLAKKGFSKPTRLSYAESLDEALCFGWIDSATRRFDEKSYCIRYTPRKQKSNWSKPNLVRVQSLTNQAKMTPAGLAALPSGD